MSLCRRSGRVALAAAGWAHALAIGLAAAPTPSLPPREPTANHALFDELNRTFRTGPEVTAAGLGCHTEAAGQIMQTTHLTTTGDTLTANLRAMLTGWEVNPGTPAPPPVPQTLP